MLDYCYLAVDEKCMTQGPHICTSYLTSGLALESIGGEFLVTLCDDAGKVLLTLHICFVCPDF